MDQLVGVLGMVMSYVVALVGLPSQILENYRRKSTEGLSLMLWVLSLLNISSWFAYGLLRGDRWIIAANVPWLVFIPILLLQFWIYRPRE